MNMKKKCVYLIVGLLTIIISIFLINAVVDKNKPWHSPSEILVTVEGYTMTLQEAIDTNAFIDGATQSHTTNLPNPGHNPSEILVTVEGYTMTLQEAIGNGFLTGENIPTQNITTEISGESHSAIDIEVAMDGSESLQDAIDDEEFQEPIVIENISNTITTVDSTDNVGSYSSITIGSDNLPIVSYYDSTNSALKILKCGDNACTSANTITIVDSYNSVGLYPSITIGSDNFPIVSYYDSYPRGHLNILKCGDNACTSANTITAVDTNWYVGEYSSITIGSDNFPIVSYFGGSATPSLKILKCGDNACTSANTITAVDVDGIVGFYTSITIGSDNLPIVSYFDYTNKNLKILKCGDNACTSGNTITTVDSNGDTGYSPSITIGSDNLPIVSYFDSTNDVLKILKCGDNACTSGNTITTVDAIDGIGYITYASITIGSDNLPIVSYFDYTNKNLKILKCGDNACTSTNTITTVDSNGDTGYSPSITIGSDNLPIVSYYDSTNDDLKILKCGTDACLV